MTISEDIIIEFEEILTDENLGSEAIEYYHGGTQYDINAIVYRNNTSFQNQRFDRGSESKQSKYDISIRISSNSTTGITSITLKEDYVKISKDISGKIYTMHVQEILAQDAGSWKLGLK